MAASLVECVPNKFIEYSNKMNEEQEQPQKGNFVKIFIILAIIHLIIFITLFVISPEQVLEKSKNYYLYVNILILITLFLIGSIGSFVTFFVRLYRSVGIKVPPKRNPASKFFWGEELTEGNYPIFYPKMFKAFILAFLSIMIVISNFIFGMAASGLEGKLTSMMWIPFVIILLIIIPLLRFFFKRV
jgi:hypothetical protein